MIPRQAGLGKSFKGAGAYYLHDKDADTSERVAFTHTENIPTQDPEKALKWMAWTAIHAEELKRESATGQSGHLCSKPVFTFSLAWHPEQQPKKETMVGAGRAALTALGLDEHETLMVAHRETHHPHLHLIVNTVHPETGQVNTLSYSKLKLSKWAESYEREHGKIYCEQRARNNEQREQGKFIKYQEPEADHKARLAQLYHAADSGKAFQAALAEAGYTLAQGKRIVVIDQDGKIHSLSRQIEGVKAKDIRAKLGDLELPFVDDARGEARQQTGKAEAREEAPSEPAASESDKAAQDNGESVDEYFDRDAQDRAWQESIVDAAIADSKSKNLNAEAQRPPRAPSPEQLNALQDRHLAEFGRHSDEKIRARLRLADEHEQQYGEHERRLRLEADHLEHVLANSGRIRTWWLKVTRQIPKTAEQDLQNMRLTLQNIEWRSNEARQALEADIARRQQDMEARHQLEKHAIGHEQVQQPINEPVNEIPDEPEQDIPDIQENPNPGEEQGPVVGLLKRPRTTATPLFPSPRFYGTVLAVKGKGFARAKKRAPLTASGRFRRVSDDKGKGENAKGNDNLSLPPWFGVKPETGDFACRRRADNLPQSDGRFRQGNLLIWSRDRMQERLGLSGEIFPPTRQTSTDTTFEAHYSVGDLARQWRLGRETVRLLVKDEPGVLKLRLGARKALTRYSIPASVARRVHTRLFHPEI